MPAMTDAHAIRTPRLLLRPMTEADRAEFLRTHTLSRDHFAPWMPRTDLTDDQQFDRILSQNTDPTILRLGGFLPDGPLAGIFSLTQIFRGPFQNAYAGWRVSADQVGRGLATEGVRALLTHALSTEPVGLGLHRVQANIIPTNTASLRIAEKLGLRREGLALRYLQIAGRWQDHAMFAATAEDLPLR